MDKMSQFWGLGYMDGWFVIEVEEVLLYAKYILYAYMFTWNFFHAYQSKF